MTALATLPLSGAEPPAWTRPIVDHVRSASFPELSRIAIDVRLLRSKSDFFRARPRSIDLFRPMPMRYVLLVNPAAGPLASSDPAAIEAIVAHELEHVCFYTQGSRWRLLGLVRLLRLASDARWERATDERTIRRGYGAGLIRYRRWLYGNVAPDVAARKRKVYLTPEEIEQRLRRASDAAH